MIDSCEEIYEKTCGNCQYRHIGKNYCRYYNIHTYHTYANCSRYNKPIVFELRHDKIDNKECCANCVYFKRKRGQGWFCPVEGDIVMPYDFCSMYERKVVKVKK